VYMRMLVLLDGSELAERVFKYARELSGRLHVNLDLLQVCSPQEAEQLPMRRAYIQQKADLLRAEAVDIGQRCGNPMGSSIEAQGSVVVGYHAEEILKYVGENDIDIIMMSTHGSSGIKAWDLGSVASKVIHASRVPVWLVPSGLREEIILDQLPRRRLLIPLSGSKGAESIIPHAVNIAQRRGRETDVELLHVLPASPKGEGKGAEMQAYLDSMAERVRGHGLTVLTKVLSGDPAAAIVQYTEEYPPQLLTIGTHPRTGVSSTTFGEVAEALVNSVKTTPLLLVPEEA
jgi:nucleotide-binding universal stress UspA family protein